MINPLSSAARMLRRNRSYSLAVVATLTVGIGMTTAMFSIVSAVFLQPLPYPDAERIIAVHSFDRAEPDDRGNVSYHNYLDMRDAMRTMTAFGIRSGASLTLTGAGEPRRLSMDLVSSDLVRVLDIRAAVGRTFVAEDDRPESPRVVMLSHALWQSGFGADSGVVGRSITLESVEHEVIGILEPGFAMPRNLQTNTMVDGLVTAAWYGSTNQRGWRRFDGFGLLARGSTIDDARQELSLVAARLEEAYPDANRDQRLTAVPIDREIRGRHGTVPLLLLGGVGLLLVIACGNAANLQLARGFRRHQEMAVRSALGASPKRLTAEILAESVTLSMIAAAIGSVVAYAMVPATVSLMPADTPRLHTATVDWRVLLFTVGVALLAATLFGLLPAIRARRIPTQAELRRGRATLGRGLKRTLDVVTTVEFAMSAILIVAGGLLLKSFVNLTRVDPGIQPAGAVALTVRLAPDEYPTETERVQAFRLIYESVRNVRGVVAAGGTLMVPLSGASSHDSFQFEEGSEVREAGAEFKITTPGYVEGMGIPVLRGRPFHETDRAESEPVAVVNQAMADRFWPDGDAIGQRIRHGSSGPWRTIVGVVADVRHHALGIAPQPEFHVPQTQEAWPSTMALIVRTDADLPLTQVLRDAIWSVDPNVPVADVQPLERIVSDSIAVERARAVVLALFAVSALVLAAIGIYSVTAFNVNARTHEVGVRIALGAPGTAIVRAFLHEGLRVVVIGLALGFAVAGAGSRLIGSFLYGVEPTDPATFVAVGLTLASIAAVAILIPATRASKLDPMTVMREE